MTAMHTPGFLCSAACAASCAIRVLPVLAAGHSVAFHFQGVVPIDVKSLIPYFLFRFRCLLLLFTKYKKRKGNRRAPPLWGGFVCNLCVFPSFGGMVCYSTILFFPERNGWCGRRNPSLTLFQAWSYPILRKLSHFQTQTYILLPQHYSIELYWADTP